MIEVRFRSIDPWPHPVTTNRRWHPFRNGWRDTLGLLEDEIRKLKGRGVMIGAGFRPDIRLDGWPRSDARTPSHPGVEISFTAGTMGDRRLIYATDACRDWQDNVRSVALGLEALRAVDRYGITRRGEQYAGFGALPPAIAVGPALSEADAWRVLERAAGFVVTPAMKTDEPMVRTVYRRAVAKVHPDAGGSREDFDAVQAAGRALGVAS